MRDLSNYNCINKEKNFHFFLLSLGVKMGEHLCFQSRSDRGGTTCNVIKTDVRVLKILSNSRMLVH